MQNTSVFADRLQLRNIVVFYLARGSKLKLKVNLFFYYLITVDGVCGEPHRVEVFPRTAVTTFTFKRSKLLINEADPTDSRLFKLSMIETKNLVMGRVGC